MEQHPGNATSTNFLHQLRDQWKSPRGTVIRIEILALVSIALSFFLAAFGSCCRWSKSWIIQKGVLAANALSLSMGTYSIGLMQSSSVKSEMHPIWGVSLLTLFGCVDSLTSYSLDYKGQLWKMLFQICIYCGYVLLISISTISSNIGNIAISVLSAITFIKGIHRSLALVLSNRMRDMVQVLAYYMRGYSRNMDYNPEDLDGYRYVVHWPLEKNKQNSAPRPPEYDGLITTEDIRQCSGTGMESDVGACKDVCLSFALSHLLQRRFYGLRCAETAHPMTREFVFKGLLPDKDGPLGYERAFKVIELELAFLFDVFFTSNAFLNYYESKAATIWAFASVIGICFVVVAAVIPATRFIRRTSGSITVVDTTAADLVITLVILVSLALLQVFQLLRCWTSNWARVSFVCEYINKRKKGISQMGCRMRLKAFLSRINWFDNYLWQNKLGQYSLVESISTRECQWFSALKGSFSRMYSPLSRVLGLQYIEQVLHEMWGSKTGDSIELHADVKEAIAIFLRHLNGELTDGFYTLQGVRMEIPEFTEFMELEDFYEMSFDSHTVVILMWHVATCYCELAQRNKGFAKECTDREILMKNHRVATALSKYCAYLLVSAPQLLRWRYFDTKSTHDDIVREAKMLFHGVKDKFEAMRSLGEEVETSTGENGIFRSGVKLGKRLERLPQCWNVLAAFWVERLVFLAPSDNAEEHIRQLSQGGELITHLWALLSHAGILNREPRSQQHDVDTALTLQTPA